MDVAIAFDKSDTLTEYEFPPSTSHKSHWTADSSWINFGNVKVVWTNGDNVSAAPKGEAQAAPAQVKQEVVADLPF